VKYLILIIVVIISYSSYGQFRRADSSCVHGRKLAFDNMIKGTENSRPLIVANGLIICMKELDEKKIDTTAATIVMECKDAYAKFGNLAARGVISLKTKQIFETISVKELRESKKIKTTGHQTMLAINGFITNDYSLVISRNAIDKIDVLLKVVIGDKVIDPNIAVVNIWTNTKKERRSSGPFSMKGSL
jgi:hypothetical protein